MPRTTQTRGWLHVGVLAAALLLLQGSCVLGYAPLTFHPPFQNSRVDGWNIMGSTMVTEQFVRLTSAEAGQEGAIWSADRVPYTDWEVEIAFKATGARYLGGDGFGLWFTEKSEAFGGTFGNQEDFVGLGIIFDTYDNDGKRDNPSISAIYSDGSMRFNHDDDGRKQIIPGASCKINYRNPRAPIMAKVKYQDGTLVVSYDMRSRGVWTECFRTSELVMPPSYFLGLTAHTGQVADNHDVYKLITLSLDAEEAASPEQDTMATDQQHHPGESDKEQQEWHKDDDRHLQRFADAIARFVEMSPETQALASEARRQLLRDREIEANAVDADAEPIMGGDEMGGGGDGLGQHFKDEVSSTLSLIQEEIKQIAHEMRGTITLAHAVTQGDADDKGGGGGGGASASELLTGISEVVAHSSRTVSNDVGSMQKAIAAELENVKKDVRDVHNTIRNTVVRNNQEMSTKLSAMTNDVTKMKSTIEELKKRTDYTHGKLESSATELKDHIQTNLGGGGGGLSLITLAMTQIPLLAYVIYSRFFAGPKDEYQYKQRV